MAADFVPRILDQIRRLSTNAPGLAIAASSLGTTESPARHSFLGEGQPKAEGDGGHEANSHNDGRRHDPAFPGWIS
jgi:hypothetical protein